MRTNERPQFRVEDKGNVNYQGRKTGYKIFEWDAHQGAYLYAGNGFVRGWNASDEKCIADFVEARFCRD